MKQEKRGYVIADGGRAKLLLRHGTGRYETVAVLRREPEHHPRSDSRTRVFQSLGRGRSAVGDDPGERARHASAFVDEIEAAIAQAVEGGRFERFVLAAPPRVLGAIRTRLDERLQDRVICEFAKDLTKLPEAELHQRLDRLTLLG